jgi:hypothetical protein
LSKIPSPASAAWRGWGKEKRMLEFLKEFVKLDTWTQIVFLLTVVVLSNLFLSFIFSPISRALYAVAREIRLLRIDGKKGDSNDTKQSQRP